MQQQHLPNQQLQHLLNQRQQQHFPNQQPVQQQLLQQQMPQQHLPNQQLQQQTQQQTQPQPQQFAQQQQQQHFQQFQQQLHQQHTQQQQHLPNQQLQQQNQQLQQQKQQQMQQHRQQYQQQQNQQQQTLNNMQYQPYQQQANTGQQQHSYASQYIQQLQNQPRMQCLPPYATNARPAAELPRANFNPTTAFTNNASNNQITPISTAMYFPQSSANTMSSSSSSYPLPTNTYNSQAHLSNHPSNYSVRPHSIQHIRLQNPPVQAILPNSSVSTVQPIVRPQVAITQQQLALLISQPGVSIAPTNTVRPQQLLQQLQQRPTYIAVRPQPAIGTSEGPSSQGVPISLFAQNRMPATTPTAPVTSSAVYIRPTISSNLEQPTTTTPNRVAQKRPVVVESGISASPPAPKGARTREETTAHLSQHSGDCEVLIVQKKQVGLPVIQSVAGSSTSSAPKTTGQGVQTPSVASLMSNPNITVTPAKNKENPTGTEPVKAVTTATVVGNTAKSVRPVTVDLSTINSSTQQTPSWKNPLTCQVCNET